MAEKGYDRYIPRHQVTCKGIARDVDRNIDEEEIK